MLRLFFLLAVAATASAQSAKVEKPKFLYGHDFKVRDVGKKNFAPTTPRVGVEVFHDPAGDALIAISEAGHLTAAPFKKAGDDKKADWISAFELNVRPADEASFTKASKFATEVFKDLGSGRLLMVTSQRTLAWADAPSGAASDKEPEWHHALVLKVRAPEDKEFAGAVQLGIEVYRDGTSGQLVYLTDKGAIATAAAPTKKPDAEAVKKPTFLHGISLSSRKADEGDFTDKTKSYGIEVYQDPNSGAILYLSETGSLATVPGGEVKKGQGVKWDHSFVLNARKGGEKNFDKASRFGVEVFEDKNTGALIYICENGSIAALKK